MTGPGGLPARVIPLVWSLWPVLKPMILLLDHFNGTRISRHRTVAGAIKARIAHARRLNRNSPGSYVWYRITDSDGRGICGELQMEIERTLQSSAR